MIPPTIGSDPYHVISTGVYFVPKYDIRTEVLIVKPSGTHVGRLISKATLWRASERGSLSSGTSVIWLSGTGVAFASASSGPTNVIPPISLITWLIAAWAAGENASAVIIARHRAAANVIRRMLKCR